MSFKAMRPPAAFVQTLLLGLTGLLTACGGSDGDDPVAVPPVAATVTAAPDTATLAWRTSAVVDVLANDIASRGALVLSAVGAPGHGTAAIDNGRLRYTPADGWFGSDSVTYTVQAVEGGATATATLTLTVQARLTLSGLITDAPVAGAAVVVQVGDTAVPVVADTQGRYTAEVVGSDPAALVQVTGTSPDGRVKLVSAVGTLAQVAAFTTAGSSAVGSDRLSALDATHWSTAAAALMARANGGTLPTTAAALTEAAAAVDPQQQLNLAAAVRLVADGGAALPAGSADTLALVLDEAATEAFIASQTAFSNTRSELLADAPQVAGFVPEVTQPTVLVFSTGNPVTSGGASVRLQPDGRATVYLGATAASARWQWQAGTLSVTFDQPVVQQSFPLWTDPVTGAQVQLEAAYRTLAFTARQISGNWTSGNVELNYDVTYTYTAGPPAGQAVDGFVDPPGGYLVGVRDLAAAAGLTPAELVAGTRIAGLPVGGSGPSSTPSREDIVRLAADGSARLELSARDARWSLEAGWLVLTIDGVSTRYTRLSRDANTGIEVWAGVGRFDGIDDHPVEFVAGVVNPGLAFTTANAARRWRSEGFFVVQPDVPTTPLSLFAGGTASGSPIVTRWRIGEGGVLAMVRVRNGVEYARNWIPISRVGPHWVVLEQVDFSFAEGGAVEWRVNWYRDLGTADL